MFHILVVDDDKNTQLLFKSILEKAKSENRKKTKRRVMAGTLISVQWRRCP